MKCNIKNNIVQPQYTNWCPVIDRIQYLPMNHNHFNALTMNDDNSYLLKWRNEKTIRCITIWRYISKRTISNIRHVVSF